MLPPVDTRGVLALRAEILAKSASLQKVAAPEVPAGLGPSGASPGFATAMQDALRAVSAVQDQAGAMAAAYERGETQDLASVMIARQKASIAFEATLQVRNRLLGAYKDVMNLPL